MEDFDDIIQIDQQYVDRVRKERDEPPLQLFKPGEYVLIKAEMSAGDDAWIQNHAITTEGQGKKLQVHVNIGDVKLATLQRMIKGWHLMRTMPDPHNGQPRQTSMPFDPRNVEKISKRLYSFIATEIDRLNPDENEEVDEGGKHPLQLSVISSSLEDPEAMATYQVK